MERYYAYFLRLGQGYYYVGISKNPAKRIHSHLFGEGCELSRKYGVEEIIGAWDIGERDKQSAETIEENITKCLMKKYGDKVRGGRMCSENKSYTRCGDETYLNRFENATQKAKEELKTLY